MNKLLDFTVMFGIIAVCLVPFLPYGMSSFRGTTIVDKDTCTVVHESIDANLTLARSLEVQGLTAYSTQLRKSTKLLEDVCTPKE